MTDSEKSIGPVIYPLDWDDTAKYPLSENNNNYTSQPGVDDIPNIGINLAACKDVNCFVPNSLSTSLVDQGDSAKAAYKDGSAITEDFLGEKRPQGASIDIGAFEKHETSAAYPDNYTTDQDKALVVPSADGVLKNDTYPSFAVSTVVTDTAHGNLLLNADGSFEYQPNQGYYGNDEFEYAVDGQTAKVSLTVRSNDWLLIPDNIPPTARDDSYSVYSDSVDNIASPGVLFNDSDEINQTAPFYEGLTARLYKQASNGTVSLNTDGSFVYTPNSGFVGDDTFEYEVFDPSGMHSTPAVVRLHVQNGVPHGGKITVARESAGSTGIERNSVG